MTSSASWNDGGLSPELYQAAREAAHRAGMSVDDWLRSTFGNSPVRARRASRAQTGPLGARLGELSQRFGHAAEAVCTRRSSSVRGARLDRHRRQAQRTPRSIDHRPAGPGRLKHAEPVAPRREPRLRRRSRRAIRSISASTSNRRDRRAAQHALDTTPSAQHRTSSQLRRTRISRSLEQQLQHITDQIESLAAPVRRRRCDRRAAHRPRRGRARHQRSPAAPHAGKPAGRRERARRADRPRLWPRRRSFGAARRSSATLPKSTSA